MLITSFLAGAGALVGATVLFAHRREARAAKLYPPMGQDVEVDGIRMHVEMLGPASGDAPDLVLIHGSNGNSRDFTLTLAPALADRYRIFIVDRPGLGWSDMHPDGSSLVTQARLIQGAVDQLGARTPIVLGQSYGGAVALSWAATLPGTLSAVVAVSAATHPWNTGRALRDEIAALAPQWRNISVPIEAVHGDADPIVSHIIHSERLAEEHELTELTLLPGQGHMPHHVAENDVVAAIDRAALRANVK
ncbi:MAG: alpha/beta fold hydrolase [Maritimibacter sp.]